MRVCTADTDTVDTVDTVYACICMIVLLLLVLHDGVCMPRYKKIWKIINEWRDADDHRLLYKILEKPHPCDVCDNGAEYMTRLIATQKEVRAHLRADDGRVPPKLQKLHKALAKKVKDFERHKAQYKRQRPYMQKREE